MSTARAKEAWRHTATIAYYIVNSQREKDKQIAWNTFYPYANEIEDEDTAVSNDDMKEMFVAKFGEATHGG